MNEKKERIKELVAILNRASRAYYQADEEVMSNREYDRLYDELVRLEEETGIVLSSSPTVNVGYEVVSSLPKKQHPSPMLSLDKTKDPAALAAWLGDQEGLLSWKLDGLTIVLTYVDGKLSDAVTRGDGITGEVITGNAKVFDNVPLTIPAKEETVIRGEAVISYPQFETINASIEEAEARYKNPRNLCSGTVRQLDSSVTAGRHVLFYAFSLASGGGDQKRRRDQMEWLRGQGFETVENIPVTRETVEEAVTSFAERIADFEIPSDGLVLTFDDIAYGRSLGTTAKFPRDSIAFKWQDELAETTLRQILWNPSRTGLINPIAVFDPVELEGTTVSRASVHNLSIVEQLQLVPGDRIQVYKANMIIPQIEANLCAKAGRPAAEAPGTCPACGGETAVRDENGIRTLRCPNPDCPAKKIKSFTHFVGRTAMNIEGLSEATLEKLIGIGALHQLADIVRLDRFREEIVGMEGFGEKSFENLIAACEKASHTTPDRLLNSLGIPGIGSANAQMICRAGSNRWEKISGMTEEALLSIDGIGDVLAGDFTAFFADDNNRQMLAALLEELTLDESFEERADQPLQGKTFVITGSLNSFENRDAAKEKIRQLGGKVAGSVSKKTNYLVNNDIDSASSKNKKAKELGIPIITEDELLEMIEQ
ncbi:MAG: NAD-dependent DNA ligase LigA [Firmicutes bacterium]|nr:NAD-dependent DNA ligase LigA [Bacillota bacterium]